MKTFTLDSLSGEMNTEIKWIENKTRKQLQKVVEEFIKDCIENDIEVCSSDGFFIEMVFQELIMSRSKQVFEVSKKEKLNKQENNQ